MTPLLLDLLNVQKIRTLQLMPSREEFCTLLNLALDRPHPSVQKLQESGTLLFCAAARRCQGGTGQLDQHGYHALSCPRHEARGHEVIHRSNMLGRALTTVLEQCLKATVEREAFLPSTSQHNQRAQSDLFLPHGLKPGHSSEAEPPLHIDVVVTSVAAQMSATQRPAPRYHGHLTSYLADVADTRSSSGQRLSGGHESALLQGPRISYP